MHGKESVVTVDPVVSAPALRKSKNKPHNNSKSKPESDSPVMNCDESSEEEDIIGQKIMCPVTKMEVSDGSSKHGAVTITRRYTSAQLADFQRNL